MKSLRSFAHTVPKAGLIGRVTFLVNYAYSECLKQWAHEVHDMSLVVWETLLVELSAVEAEDKQA